MFRMAVGVVVAVAAFSMAGSAVYAASGFLTDPKGDFPDIVKFAYTNGESKVVMTMTYGGGRAQNESFYMRWGSKAQHHYQVFVSEVARMKELRYSGGGDVDCRGMVVKRPTARSTKVVIPRTCLRKAPSKLRFQGIATEGLYSSDETRLSKAIARG